MLDGEPFPDARARRARHGAGARPVWEALLDSARKDAGARRGGTKHSRGVGAQRAGFHPGRCERGAPPCRIPIEEIETESHGVDASRLTDRA